MKSRILNPSQLLNMNLQKQTLLNYFITKKIINISFIIFIFFSVSVFTSASRLSGQNTNPNTEITAADYSMMWDISYDYYNWKTPKEIELSLLAEKERISKLATGQSDSGYTSYINACLHMLDYIQNQTSANGDISNSIPAGYKSALANVNDTDITNKAFFPFFEYPSHLIKVLIISDTK